MFPASTSSSSTDFANSSAASWRRPLSIVLAFALALALTIGDDAIASSLLTFHGFAPETIAPNTPCHFICVKINSEGGLGHRLVNVGTSIRLAIGSGYPAAAFSVEGGGVHGNYLGADRLIFDDAAELRGIRCCESCNQSIPVQHLDYPPLNVRDNLTELGRWVLETQEPACGLIIVPEFWTSSELEPVWPQMQQLYHSLSPTALALKAQLLYSSDKLNIAIHVRAGDIIPTPLTYFALCLRSVLAHLEASSLHSAVDVWLFSETSIPSVEAELFAAAQAFDLFPTMLRLDAQSAPPLLTFMYLTEADILLASDSGFSWAASFMSTKPVVVVASNEVRNGNKRVNLGEHQQHILAENDGNLLTSTVALKRVAAAFSLRQHN